MGGCRIGVIGVCNNYVTNVYIEIMGNYGGWKIMGGKVMGCSGL